MSRNTDFERRGIPTSLLGTPWRLWTMLEIETILQCYQPSYNKSRSKIDMFQQLDVVLRNNRFKGGSKIKVLKEIHASKRSAGDSGSRKSSTTGKRKRESTVDPLTEFFRNLATQDPISSSTTCLVCDEPFQPADPVRITSSCNHGQTICRKCLATSITSQMDSKFWNRISCPSTGCKELLTYHDVQMFAVRNVFNRYDELSRSETLDKDKSFRRCATLGCDDGGWCDPKIESYIVCRKCSSQTCITCKTAWHSGVTCVENLKAKKETEAQKEEVAKTEKMLDKAYKICPNGSCAARVEKVDGCDHMTCSRCGHEWCWLCYADHIPIFDEGNHRHNPGCQHYWPLAVKSGLGSTVRAPAPRRGGRGSARAY